MIEWIRTWRWFRRNLRSAIAAGFVLEGRLASGARTLRHPDGRVLTLYRRPYR